MIKSYPRYLTPNMQPFNPLELATLTEHIVCKHGSRKYTAFYATGVYRGIATAYTVGCCLRCFYCWVELSRDFPEKFGRFCTPEEVVDKLEKAARHYGTRKCRISGGEPTLCKEHLMNVLKLVDENDFFMRFILETNGILLGADDRYVKDISHFEKVYVRVSIKAGFPKSFTKRTGALGEFYELPFGALEKLNESGIDFHAAAMTDPRIMGKEERKEIIKRLERINPRLVMDLEEEIIDPYDTTLFRLKKAKINVSKFFNDAP